ncbi:PEPxxWA-CTERM sorting domain-containing protein [Sphingomonas sp.]|uniref:PEPxxWA-CTERM sorting domain-containing protein n=1 Tax=Sphingomonas sp. TaxID=28214 RepID=UPI0039C9E093
MTYMADLAPARGLSPVGQVTVNFDPVANTIRFLVAAAAGTLAQGDHQLHLHANYAGNLLIGDPLTPQVKALAPALSDDVDGDGAIEVFESTPVIGESFWNIATVAAAADGSLNYDSGLLSTASSTLFAPDPITVGSPGVSGPEDVDFPTNIDNIGFYRSALDQFNLLAFDIHGAPDPAGIGATPGEVDAVDGFEALRPALAGSFAAVAAVPEPASWAMMIGGFGVIGGAMRSRRKVSVRFA